MTALSTSTVNVEVVPGNSLGRIKRWSVKNGAGSEKCSFSVDNILKDCTDERATSGRNEYSVFGEWQDGSWGPKKAAIETLTKNRKCSASIINRERNVSIVNNLTTLFRIASSPMTLIRQTSNELAIRFSPTQPSDRYELVARNPLTGRARARCANSECRLSGLRPFSNYTLWLVTCSGSNPKRCMLQAPPMETSTLPASKYDKNMNCLSFKFGLFQLLKSAYTCHINLVCVNLNNTLRSHFIFMIAPNNAFY